MKLVQAGLLAIVMCFLVSAAAAQVSIEEGHQVAAPPAPEKKPELTLSEFADLYSRVPDSVYTEYLKALLAAKKYKDAEKVVEKQKIRNPTWIRNAELDIDMGVVLSKEGKEERAKEQFENVLKLINGDDMVTQRMAKAFTDRGRDDYAILTYEKAIRILNTQYIYGVPLARLYAKAGNLDKTIEVLLSGNPGQYITPDNAKALLLELLGSDAAKLQQMQKALVKKINEQPENNYYADILTWIYTQKNDWDGALIQIEAIDERNKETGRRLIEFAHNATAAKEYDIADKAYDEVILKGKELPYYLLARAEKLSTSFARIKKNVNYKPEEVRALAALYDSFLHEYPRQYGMQAAADYATLLAQYGNDVPGAVEILQKGIAQPDIKRTAMGAFKLQMGDYYVLMGRLWDASLTYSQVDKEFKQDATGEDARFRNAKIAYYRGDFEWAQKQLSILKASTSDLIANDALYLSVLITENVEDSNYVPLERFAHADLLLAQNKFKEAETLLDSLSKVYPKHPLNDDIIMAHANIAIRHHDYAKALDYLKTITEQFGKDVLADDALFMMAGIYEDDLHVPDQAKHYYEQLIIDFPGSTYVQAARQKLYDLTHTPTP